MIAAILLAGLAMQDLPDAPRPQPKPVPVYARPFALNVSMYERWKLSQFANPAGYRESTVIFSLDERLARSRVRIGISWAIVINERGELTYNTSAGMNVKLVTFGRFR